jgi:hypothetical protein
MDRTCANEPVASSWTLASGLSSIDVAACMGEASLVSKRVDRVGNACVLCLQTNARKLSRRGDDSAEYED